MTKTFMNGATYASGHFAEREELCKLLDIVKSGKYPRWSAKLRTQIETSLNNLALAMVRYSNTEWGNDYYWQVEQIAAIMNWLEYYERKHKSGRHFSLS